MNLPQEAAPVKEADSHSTLADALALASEGFRVFPLTPGGKTPALNADWRRIATSDADRVRAMWWDPVMEVDQPFNIGIATGDGRVVIDVDDKNGKSGSATLMRLELEHGDLPATRVVRTPSGGRHLHFRCSRRIGCSAGKLGPGFDVRGEGGYVAGVGSTIGGIAYVYENDDATADLPEPWEAALARQSPPKPDRDAHAPPLVPDYDVDGARDRALAYLETAAVSVQGDGGNNQAYLIANEVKDRGVATPLEALEVMGAWNDRCLPPWPPDELLTIIQSAYKHGQNPVGSKARVPPEAEFEPVDVVDRRTAGRTTLRYDFLPIQEFDFGVIPRRRWVVERLAVRGIISGLIAPGGVGKTTFLIALALAVATGRNDILGLPVRERTRVLFWNQEDDTDELHRRLAAEMTARNVTWSDLRHEGRGMLFMESGVGRPLMFAGKNSRDETVPTPAAHAIGQFIRENDIGLAIFDPLVELHGDPENDNVRMKAVAAVFRDTIAVPAQCAVVLAHHTHKPREASTASYAGDMNAARGAGSLVAAFRLASTLFGLDEKTAASYGIPDDSRHLYVRWDEAKSNLSMIGPDPVFFQKSGIRIGAEGGESVGVLTPVKLVRRKGKRDQAREELIDDVFDLLESAPSNSMTAIDLARALTADPMRADISVEGLSKALKNTFKDDISIEGRGSVQVETQSRPGVPGRHATLIFSPCGVAESPVAEQSA